MSPSRTAPRQRSKGNSNRPARQRDIAPVIRTLEPQTSSFLLPKWRPRARVAAFLPLVLLVIGIVLLGAHTLFPLGIVVLATALIVVALVFGLVNVWLGSPVRVLRSLPSGNLHHVGAGQLLNLLDGLCVGNGLSVPEIRIVHDEAANAFVLGWSEKSATLVVTTGLLDVCSRIELEGVLAHELAHIKSGDLRDAAFASVGVGLFALVSSRAPSVLRWLVQPAREATADMGGVSMTRYPPGLMRALITVRAAHSVRPSCLSKLAVRLTAPLWLVNLDEPQPHRSKMGLLDLEERISVLAEL